jgi:hypothetical protein
MVINHQENEDEIENNSVRKYFLLIPPSLEINYSTWKY